LFFGCVVVRLNQNKLFFARFVGFVCNLPCKTKFQVSNLRQFQAGKINFTAKSTKFKA